MSDEEMTEEEFFELEKKLTKIVMENSPLFRKMRIKLSEAVEEADYWQRREERLSYLVGRVFWRYIKQNKIS